MVVNHVIDGSNQPQISEALNQGNIQSELNRIQDEKKLDEKAYQKRLQERTLTQKALDSKRSAIKLARDILGNLVDKIGASINLSQALQSKGKSAIKDEYDLMLRDGKEDREDQVQLSKGAIARAKNQKSDQQKGNNLFYQESSSELSELLAEYSPALSQSIVSGGQDAKKKLENLRNKLRMHMSLKDIQALDKKIADSLRGAIADELQNLFLKKFFSREKSLDGLMAERGLADLHEEVGGSHRLGGKDLGNYMGGLDGMAKDQLKKLKGEMKDHLTEEIEGKLIAKKLGKDVSNKELKQLIDLAMKAGFNPDKFLKEWKVKGIHLGLNPFTLDVGKGTIGQDGRRREKKHLGDFSKDEKTDLLINQLRAIYMQRALKGDWRTFLSTAFKMRKLKNGLIKLGVTFEHFKQIELEGNVIAKQKTMEMLKDVIHEKASLHEHHGSAYKLIQQRIKIILNNLKRLKVEISEKDLKDMENEANRQMFEVARLELKHVESQLVKRKTTRGEKKQRLLVKLLKRLQEASNICPDYDPEANYSQIAEAA